MLLRFRWNVAPSVLLCVFTLRDDRLWPAKLKTFTIWPFTEDICRLLPDVCGRVCSWMSEQNPSVGSVRASERQARSRGGLGRVVGLGSVGSWPRTCLAVRGIGHRGHFCDHFCSQISVTRGGRARTAFTYPSFGRRVWGACLLPAPAVR